MSAKNYIFWGIIAVLSYLFLEQIQPILLPFIVGILVGYFLDPLADKLEEWGFSRSIATSIITISFFSILIMGCIYLLPELFSQGSQLIAVLPTYAVDFYAQYESYIKGKLGGFGFSDSDIEQQILQIDKSKVAGVMGDFVNNILLSSLSILSLISMIIISPVVAFYFLRDWDKMVEKAATFIPRHNFETVKNLAIEIDTTISQFLRGQVTVIFLIATFYSFALYFAGLNYAFALGIISGLLIIIPYVGLVLGLILTVATAYFQFDDLNMVLLVAAIYGIGQLLESGILTPNIVGDKVGLHPVWVLFSILAGGALFGFLGVLIAVPVAAVIGVLVRYGVSQYLSSGVYDNSKPKRKTAKKTTRTKSRSRS